MPTLQELCYIGNESKLPIQGSDKYIYSTVCRRRQWLWDANSNQYTPFTQKHVKRIVDPYSNIPHIPAKTDVRLSLYYNLIALNTDLTQQANLRSNNLI